MKKLTLIAAVSLMTVWLTGCASFICGPRQSVSINSDPSIAEVVVYDELGIAISKHTTPCVVDFNRRTADYEGGQYKIVVSKEGYEPVEVELKGAINRAFFANILNGGIGFIVDPITGAMWTLMPEKVDAKLVSSELAFLSKKEGLFICLKEEVPSDLLPYLVPVRN